MVGMPMRMVLFCAREIKGAKNVAEAATDAPHFNSWRRWDELWFGMSISVVLCRFNPLFQSMST
jgi:hypothetical protein